MCHGGTVDVRNQGRQEDYQKMIAGSAVYRLKVLLESSWIGIFILKEIVVMRLSTIIIYMLFWAGRNLLSRRHLQVSSIFCVLALYTSDDLILVL